MKTSMQTKVVCRIAVRLIILFLFPLTTFAQVNNLCVNATVLNSVSTTCVNTAGTLVGATYTVTVGACGAGTPAGNRNDVWYSFTAQSTNPTITLSSAPAQSSIQLFSGTCGTPVSVQCAVNSTTLVASGLTINTVYLIRIWSNNNTAGIFNICITNPAPANDVCGSAVVLTSAITCATPVQGNLGPASTSSITVGGVNCATTVFDDIWYRFVAQTTNPTITIAGLSGFANPGMQLLTENCGSTFMSLFCGTTSITADFLTPGNSYFIRVFSTTDITASAGFNICVTDPVSPAPANDECANAANLSVDFSCSNLPGNMAGATASPIALGGICAGPLVYDVWYAFTATNTTATVNLSNFGANFTNANARIEILSGTCGSFTTLACGTSPRTASALTAGNKYYVRVYSIGGSIPNGNARFDICLTSTLAPVVRFGNGYINLTKKTVGGVVEPNDSLEIRMSILNNSGTSMTNLRFVDNVPTKTAMGVSVTDRIRVITNEGLTYKQYTLGADGDPATYKASPGGSEFNIRMNLGFGGTNPGTPPDNTATNITTTTGTMINTNRPSLFGNSLIFATAYRVKVTGVVGDTIVLSPARFIYRQGVTDVTLTATPFKILITAPLNLCTNSIGLNNAVESGGNFGTGTLTNRGNDLATPIAGYSFLNNVNNLNNLNDGSYAIVKNTSPRYSTNRNANYRRLCGILHNDDADNCNKRMHDGHWYIDGDHTGTSNAIGNTPPAPATNSGYMLMVNADYVASEVYKQTISNLCPSTYYEFSAWFRNICPTCGSDSTGAQFAGTVTAPTNGYPGVYPNLTFALNGVDYYNTGEMDTVGWIKKGFLFKTGPLETSASFSIRNNSQGGGGNDWVMDDIAVATCFPDMRYSPSSNPNICEGNSLQITDTVLSFFDNYVEYKWQRWSAATSGPWTDISGTSGTGTPVWNGTAYQYVSAYTIPALQATALNDGDMYRLVVASTTGNLSSTTCSYTDPASIELNVVIGCGPPLKADLLSASGRLTDNIGKISWVTSKEDEPVSFSIERSDNGIDFRSIGLIDGYNNINFETNYYNYTDPVAVTSKVYYRVVMINNQQSKKYSAIIQLTPAGKNGLNFTTVVNPFNSELRYEVNSPVKDFIRIELIDGYGKIVRKETQQLYAGTNSLSIYNTGTLAAGVYILRGSINGNMIYRKVIKEMK